MNCMTRIGTNSDRTECGVVFPHVCVIFRYILFCVRPVLQSVYERIGRTQLVLLCLHPRKAFPIGVGKVHKRRAVRFEIGLIFNSPVTREIRNYSFIVCWWCSGKNLFTICWRCPSVGLEGRISVLFIQSRGKLICSPVIFF